MEVQCSSCKLYGHEESHCDHLAKTIFVIKYAKKNPEKAERVADAFSKKNSQDTQALIGMLTAGRSLPLQSPAPAPAPAHAENYYDEDDDDNTDYFEDYLGNMLAGYGSSICTAEAPAHATYHNKELLSHIDTFVMQTVHLPPIPDIAEPATNQLVADSTDVPVICQINSPHTTDAQADTGANRAITDNFSLLHNPRQMTKPYPVGSINANTKLYCTAVGELHLRTEEAQIERFPCLYSAQSPRITNVRR
jgi:hypothetical protein